MTCTGDQESYPIFKRLWDNLGELVYMIFIGLPGKDASGWYVANNQYNQPSTLWVSHVYVSIIVVVVIDNLAVSAWKLWMDRNFQTSQRAK